MPFLFPIMVKPRFANAYNQILILMYGMLFRVLVGLYSCVYVAQKNAKKIASTSIMAAIINLGVDLLLIRRIQLFAASVSTLVAFLVMFVIRYIDINRTVHMRIRPMVAVGSIVNGALCAVSFYCGNRLIQAAVFVVVAAYSIVINLDMVRAGIKLVRTKLGHRS